VDRRKITLRERERERERERKREQNAYPEDPKESRLTNITNKILS
jgi:hypothetical protein